MDKETKRALKAAKSGLAPLVPAGLIDCACVIHGDVYTWTYVDRLYNMLNCHITPGVRLHVYTELGRYVPEPYIKHALVDWGISGPKKSWWYKMQLFNNQHHNGPLLYFDLDTVIVNNIDWIWQQDLNYLWTVRDFKYLWRSGHFGINSSIMWWDTNKFNYVWTAFANDNIQNIVRKYHGDQDYLTVTVSNNQYRFLDAQRIKSWRWQCLDGGYNFRKKVYHQPGTGTKLGHSDSVLIFHGKPKPEQVQDSVIQTHWK